MHFSRRDGKKAFRAAADQDRPKRTARRRRDIPQRRPADFP